MMPATHGLLTLAGLGAMALCGHQLTPLEAAVAFGFGVCPDIDHMSPDYVLDLIPRIIRGGGYPGENVKRQPCWLHLWPGFMAALLAGLLGCCVMAWFPVWLPLAFWIFAHRLPDALCKDDERFPHIPFLYPLMAAGERLLPKGIQIFQSKSPQEAMLTAHGFLAAAMVMVYLLLR